MPKLSPSFTFASLFALTETAVYEYNRIDGLYHRFCGTVNAIPEPAPAGVEGGRADLIPPDKAMKKRILILVALVALIVLGLTGVAMADEPVSMKMDLSATRFSGPAEVKVTISVSNTTDEDMPGPLALYYPNGKMISEFGTPTLAAGQTKTWEGTWMVTEEQIKAGKVLFAVQYSYLAEDGSVARKVESYYCAIEDAGAVAQVEIERSITPSMARNGQKVSVIYTVKNTGTVDVTDVVIKEASAISKTNGKIDLVKAGEQETYTFTVTMGKKNLTSSASVSYKANGKTYTETIGKQVIKYGDVKLTATLSADKKGGVEGDTVKLTLKLKNTGKSDYENITVTDATLGTVFTGLTVKAGETITQEKEITIAKSAAYQFTVTGSASGNTIETATDRITVTAVDPAQAVSLTVTAEVDKPVIYLLPDVVKFTVYVTNTSNTEAKNVTVSASDVDLYSFESILPGETRSFVRDVRVEMAGNFRFDARVQNQLEENDVFHSDLILITHSTPTAAPTMVPIAQPVVPVKEKLPTDDGLPPYVTTLQQALAIGQWVFLAIGAVALVLIVVGAVGRAKNAAQSAKSADHLERDGYRDYTQAVSAKKRHTMPEDESDVVDEPAPVEEPVAEEEAPAEEPAPEAVNDAMAELYPEAVERNAEITYNRRRKDEEK